MSDRIQKGALDIAPELHQVVEQEIIPGTGLDADHFWGELERILADFTPRNRELLQKRVEIQEKIDAWHRERRGQKIDLNEYKQFLTEIGYLQPEGDDFQVSTDKVDPEIATVAGPQLVVPVRNARFALNAANARWGSLYDALYGTDMIPETDGAEKGGAYNPKRGEKVIAWARGFLDKHFPLADVHCLVEANHRDGLFEHLRSHGSKCGQNENEHGANSLCRLTSHIMHSGHATPAIFSRIFFAPASLLSSSRPRLRYTPAVTASSCSRYSSAAFLKKNAVSLRGIPIAIRSSRHPMMRSFATCPNIFTHTMFRSL